MATDALDPVVAWIRATAHPLTTLDPAGDLGDLKPLRPIVEHATVVGLGASTRQAHELLAAQHRILRLLVEELGFRAVLFEMSATTGQALDEHVRTGAGDPVELLAGERPFWRFDEIVAVVRWLRDHAAAHPGDPVRVLGGDAAHPADSDADPADGDADAADPVTEQIAARAPPSSTSSRSRPPAEGEGCRRPDQARSQRTSVSTAVGSPV